MFLLVMQRCLRPATGRNTPEFRLCWKISSIAGRRLL